MFLETIEIGQNLAGVLVTVGIFGGIALIVWAAAWAERK